MSDWIKGDVNIESYSAGTRHVDVAILYGLSQKDRAHGIALKLKPKQMPFHLDSSYEWSEEEVEQFIQDYNIADEKE